MNSVGLRDPGDLSFWLGGDSPLASVICGFGPREGQLEMAQAVSNCFAKQAPLLVEAGTGTGKTLAYLMPAVLSGLKLVVSTGTKNLQDQINQKELPLLKKVMDPSLTYTVLKGRRNYLCLRRFSHFRDQPDLGLRGVKSSLKKLTDWAGKTATGDLDEIRGQGIGFSLMAEITSGSEQCLGSRCPLRDDCFLLEARRKANESRVVVVNHHLFLADLKLKSEGHGEALPRYQAAVFDEAHLLADVATQIFGTTVSRRRVDLLIKDTASESRVGPKVATALKDCEERASDLFSQVRKMARKDGSMGLDRPALDNLAPLGEGLAAALDSLADAMGKSEEEEALSQRARGMAMDLGAVAEPAPGHTVAWARVAGANASLNLSPVEVGPFLDHSLYQDMGGLVFTSATLATLGNLEPSRIRLGLDEKTDKLIVPSPFDLAGQSVLYVPLRMPMPQAPEFTGAVAGEVRRLLELSTGRAFVLFTSRRNLDAVSGMLKDDLPYPVLVQGDAPRMALLERFVEKSPSVLMATASFWQGVDVPGPALSAVIVDKLPFAPPDDPLVAARMELLESKGKSGFAHLMVPEAILSLRQGLGRLLRSERDRGLLAVLDARLYKKGYGRRFLKALEPVPVTRSLGDVAEFFAREEDASASAEP